MQAAGNNKQHIKSLSIRLSVDGLSFSVYQPQAPSADTTGEVSYRQHTYTLQPTDSVPKTLRRALAYDTLVAEGCFSQVMVIVDAPIVLVPEEEFYAEESDAFYRHVFTSAPSQKILHTLYPHLGVSALFSIDSEVYEVLYSSFPGATFYASEACLLEHQSRRSKIGEHQKIFVYSRDERYTVYYYCDGKPHFVTSYEGHTPENMAFVILSVWQQFQLDQERDELHLVGLPKKGDALKEVLCRFLRNVFSIQPSAEFNRAPLAKEQGIPYDLQVLLITRK